MLEFVNCEFAATGASASDKVFGLTISGAEDITVKNCNFTGKGYSAIKDTSTGNVDIENCTFADNSFYNTIERNSSYGDASKAQGNLTVKDSYVGKPTHVNVNIYSQAADSVVTVDNCTVAADCTGRISNVYSNAFDFVLNNPTWIENGNISDNTSTPFLFQDYTWAYTDIAEDFSDVNVKISGTKLPSSVSRWYWGGQDTKEGGFNSNYFTADNSPKFYLDDEDISATAGVVKAA